MLRIILIYGSVAGLIVAAPMVWGMVSNTTGEIPENGAMIGFATMIVALTAVFLGIKHYRDQVLGGVVRFLPALGVGLGISAVASLFWVIGWEISLAATGFDFANVYYQGVIEAERAKGASAEAIAKLTQEGADFAAMYANPLARAAITFVEMFPLGVVISLISAALLRNSRFLPAKAAA
ncbi:MAG: DUF4199 domain-containing protein [Hyphomonadaceae bacterium]|nr:DUF4199 domain-containing protein [Hyphomonadaceae bacterium]